MVHDSSRLPYETGLMQKLCTFAFIFWKTYSYDHLSKESGKCSFFGGVEGDGIILKSNFSCIVKLKKGTEIFHIPLPPHLHNKLPHDQPSRQSGTFVITD